MPARDDDDRPRRRRRDDDDDFDDRPRRRRDDRDSGGTSGGMIAVIVVGVVLVGALVLGGVFWLLFPAVTKVRESAARLQDQNNVKQLAFGATIYNDTNGKLPPAQEKVSWRVYILPYVEQDNLYRQFRVDEPWDSTNNKRYASTKIKTFVSAADSDSVETRYRVFVGPNTLYSDPFKLPTVRGGQDRDRADGTIFIVEAGTTVPWPQPRELEYDRNGPLPSLGIPGRNGFNVAMLDGSVKFVSDKTSPDLIRGGIDPADGRHFDP